MLPVAAVKPPPLPLAEASATSCSLTPNLSPAKIPKYTLCVDSYETIDFNNNLSSTTGRQIALLNESVRWIEPSLSTD